MSSIFTFTPIEIEEKRKSEHTKREERWTELTASLSSKYGETMAKEITLAFRELYSLYSSDVFVWCANLFDPKVGGYYYSNSGRDSEKTVYNGKKYRLLPDLESTCQGDGFLYSSLIDTDATERMPSWVGKRIVGFVKSLQDKKTGYFYHPQWDKDEVFASRRGRDLQFAERLLSRYGARPTYDTPHGTKGDGLLADGTVADMTNAYVYMPMGNTAPVNEECVASHLIDKASFEKYLETLTLDPNDSGTSYKLGNQFEAQGLEIVARDKVLAARGADYSLADILKKWFDDRYIPNTGCWANCNPVDHAAVNGVLKICAAYNKIEKPIPDPLSSMRAAISVITRNDIEPTHVCSVLNPWYAVSVIFTNVQKYQKNDKEEIANKIAQVRAEMIKKYPEMIRSTAKNLAKFRKPDGSFSYYPDATSFCSQGMPVANGAPNEGDLNATNICNFGIVGHMFSILGEKSVPIFCESDRMEYILALEKNRNKMEV